MLGHARPLKFQGESYALMIFVKLNLKLGKQNLQPYAHPGVFWLGHLTRIMYVFVCTTKIRN